MPKSQAKSDLVWKNCIHFFHIHTKNTMKNYHVWLLETSYHTLFQGSLHEAGVMCSSLHKYTTWCGPELKWHYVPAPAWPFCRCRGPSSSPGPHGNVGSGKCCSAASLLHQADHDAQDPDTRAVSKATCWHHILPALDGHSPQVKRHQKSQGLWPSPALHRY